MFKAIISGHIDEHFIKYYKCANWALLVLMAVVANMVSSLDMVTGILVGGFVANLNCIGLERDCKRMVRWHTIIVYYGGFAVRLEKEITKAGKGNPEELELLKKAGGLLERGEALRGYPEIAQSPILKGYALLSAKPCIVVLNTGDEVELGTTELQVPDAIVLVELKGRLEMELAQLSPEEAELFREEMGLEEPATFRLIKESYQLLGLISLFTVGTDEVRAWPIRQNTLAQRAAGAIHSDMENGFIRAEVVSYDDLIACGNHSAAQKAGKVRLEGKNYLVQDGDIVDIRFNV